MNPLNPLVALTEILLLLGTAVGVGWGIAWLQYHQRIQAQRRTIRQAQEELKRLQS